MTAFDRIRLATVMFAVLACAAACNSEPPAPAQMPPPPAPGALADPAQQAQPTPAPAVPAVPAAPAATAVPAAPTEPAPAPAVHEAATVKPVARVEEEKEKPAIEPSKPNAKVEPKESAKIAAGEPEPKKSGTASTKPAEPTASSKSAPPPPPAEAHPNAPAPEPAKATGKVTVPKTDHVHIDVPKGLQHWLDADTRMQPWVNKVVSVADGCYERERKDNPKAAGVIPIKITMHENERPDADIGSVPSSLGAVIACGTTKLMGSRPPLFTGKEGESYTVKIHFDK